MDTLDVTDLSKILFDTHTLLSPRGVQLKEGGKFRNSWRLTRACFRVLWKNPGLISYPFFAFIASFWILLGLVGYIYGMQAWVEQTDGSRWALILVLSMGALFIYMLMAFVAITPNAAIVGYCKLLLEGKKPSVGDGYSMALSRVFALIAWTILTSIVAFLSSLGRFMTTWMGFAWSVLTYFVVPVMIFEKVGPIKAVKRSKDILKKNWGESLISNFGIWTSAIVIYLVLLIILIALTFLSLTAGAFPILVYLLFLILLITILFGLIIYALKGILMASLYWYSVTGEPGFDIPVAPMKKMFKGRKTTVLLASNGQAVYFEE